MKSRRVRHTGIHVVPPAATRDNDVELASDDAVTALLVAQQGYQAAVDAADAVSLPSLTDFVD